MDDATTKVDILQKKLRVLMLEDMPGDAELVESELRKSDLDITALLVDTREDFARALEEFRPDVILSDYKLPTFNGLAAVQLTQQKHSEIPIVIVTGALSDLEAVELLKAGAKDYVLKDGLARLVPAVKRVLAMEQSSRARIAAEHELQESYRQVRLARDEWNHAFDSVHDLLFFHDREGRITRCNQAYLEAARLPFNEIIGRYYWEVFPKSDGPITSCQEEIKKKQFKSEEEIQTKDGRIFISRNFSVRDPDDNYLFSIHVLADPS